MKVDGFALKVNGIRKDGNVPVKSQQLKLLWEQPIQKLTQGVDKSAYDCFWLLHGPECNCKMNWWKWEEITKRSIWDIA